MNFEADMKLAVIALIISLTTTLAACRSNDNACKASAIKQAGRISEAECSCKVKAADKYLSGKDKAQLIAYWSGQSNEKPHIYLGRAYPSGQNKPLIKYNAYTAKECR